MKVVLVGIGSFGLGWYHLLKSRAPGLQLAVVDSRPQAAASLVSPVEPFYTRLDEALDREQPDFLVNLTPPAAHTAINHLAFDRRIPVLCEKPISEEYAEAVEIVERAGREGLLFMIAENYRRQLPFRRARALIEEGVIGEIAALHAQFFKEAYFEKEYLLKMPDPLLQDVAVHHLDLARCLAGADGQSIFARSYNPKGSRYPGNAALSMVIEMTSGAIFTYAGSLAAREHETGWPGSWRIEGTGGVMLVDDQSVSVIRGGETVRYDGFAPDRSTAACLDEFLFALTTGTEPETSGADYLRTQQLVEYARRSSREGRALTLD